MGGSPAMKVSLDGRILDRYTPDAGGDRHIVQGIDGWWDGPDISLEPFDLPGQHGVGVAAGMLRGRTIILHGVSIPAPGRTGFQAQAHIAKAADIFRRLAVLRVVEPHRTSRVEVVRPDRVRVDARAEIVDWEIPLLAPDPRKYDDILVESSITLAADVKVGSFTIDPSGDFSAYPEKVTVTGNTSMAPVTVEHVEKGRLLTLTGNVNGSGYELYPRTADVWRDGVKDYGLLDDPDGWWQLSPGSNTIRARRGSGTGSMTVKVFHRGAWIT